MYILYYIHILYISYIFSLSLSLSWVYVHVPNILVHPCYMFHFFVFSLSKNFYLDKASQADRVHQWFVRFMVIRAPYTRNMPQVFFSCCCSFFFRCWFVLMCVCLCVCLCVYLTLSFFLFFLSFSLSLSIVLYVCVSVFRIRDGCVLCRNRCNICRPVPSLPSSFLFFSFFSSSFPLFIFLSHSIVLIW